MEKKKIVRISATGVFAIAALTTIALVTPSKVEAKQGDEYRIVDWSDYSCAGTGGNCLPTITIKPK